MASKTKTSLEQYHKFQTKTIDVTVEYCGWLYQRQRRCPEGRDMIFVVCR